MLASVLLLTPMLVGATETPARSPQLQALDISVGKWVYHGTTMATPRQKAGTWTWNADCNWSANNTFLMCSFSNVWSGKAVKSLVVDTWNDSDKTYWHYEMFAGGDGGAKPFISRMSIEGDVWTEYGSSEEKGKKTAYRIVYRYTSPTRVSVKLETSKDGGAHWYTFAEGAGIKQS
ncbi:MAG TPA: hypothetical protein VFX47_05160, partial [Gammaproteobacteria bacterium]|nr:hypothetical protein [Gammaproteobacteria bacterium]